MPDDLDKPVTYLLGSNAAYSYPAAEVDEEDATQVADPEEPAQAPRANFRHHTIQRILVDGAADNPAIEIEACLVADKASDDAYWFTIATLNNTTTTAQFTDRRFSLVRAARVSDATVSGVKVVIASYNAKQDM